MDLKIVKNRFAAPCQCSLELLYGIGINKNNEIFELAVKKGIIVKAGSWFTYENKNIGQGKESAMSYLIQNNLIDSIELTLKE